MEFKEFLSSCSVMLEGENPLILALIQKRYDNCSESFRSSAEMTALLETTATKMRTDHQRLFVHVKNLVTELKAQAAGGGDAGQPSRKRKAENPLQTVAKLSRIEDSHSDGSDLEGMLQAHRTSVLSSVPCAESTPLSSQIPATESQTKQPEDPIKLKGSEAVGGKEHPSAEKESVHTSLSSVEEDFSHALPSHAENKSGLQCVSLSVSGKELDHTSIAQAGKGSDHTSVSPPGKKSNDTSLSHAGKQSSHVLCSPAKKEVVSSVNDLDSVLCVDVTPEQSSDPLSSSQSCSTSEKKCSAQGNGTDFPSRSTPPSSGVIPADASGCIDDKVKTNINGSLEELGLSAKTCDLNTVHSKPEDGCSDLHSMPDISDKPRALSSDSKLRMTPVQLTFPNKNKEMSVTEALSDKPRAQKSDSKLRVTPVQLTALLPNKNKEMSLTEASPDNPQTQSSDSKLRVTPVQLTFPNKTKEMSVTEASPLGSVLGSGRSKVISSRATQPTANSKKAVSSKTNDCVVNWMHPLPSSTTFASPTMFDMTCDDDDDELILIDSDEKEPKKPDVKCGSEALTRKEVFIAASADNHHRPSQPSAASSPKAGMSSLPGGSCAKEPPSSVSQDAMPVKPSKEAKHVKKYEELLEKIRDKIEKVREKELSIDDLDAEDSSYIFEDRLQKKFIKVWEKLCRLKQCSTSSGRPVERRFKFEGTRYPEINRKIQKFVNRPDTFPDYHDIKGIVKKADTRCKLGLSALQINEISREAFLDVGEALQKRRHEDFISTFHSRQTMSFCTDQDPALFDDELRRKLDENQRIGKSRLEEVISKYSDLQMQLTEAGKDDTGGTDSERSVKSDSDGEDSKGSVKARAKTPVRKVGNRLTCDDDDDNDPYSMIELDIAEDYHLSEEYCPGSSHCEESSATGAGIIDHKNIREHSNPDKSGDCCSKSGSKDSGHRDLTEQRTTVSENSRGNLSANDKVKYNTNSPFGHFKDSQALSGKQHSPNTKVNGDAVGQNGPNARAVNRVEWSPSRSRLSPRTNPLSKSRSPVMVNTSLRLPKFLFRNNGQHGSSKPETLFYPDKMQGAVSSEENDGGVTIIGSSDEETGRVAVKTEPIVEKELDDFECPGHDYDDSVIVLSDSD